MAQFFLITSYIILCIGVVVNYLAGLSEFTHMEKCIIYLLALLVLDNLHWQYINSDDDED